MRIGNLPSTWLSSLNWWVWHVNKIESDNCWPLVATLAVSAVAVSPRRFTSTEIGSMSINGVPPWSDSAHFAQGYPQKWCFPSGMIPPRAVGFILSDVCVDQHGWRMIAHWRLLSFGDHGCMPTIELRGSIGSTMGTMNIHWPWPRHYFINRCNCMMPDIPSWERIQFAVDTHIVCCWWMEQAGSGHSLIYLTYLTSFHHWIIN